LLSIKQSKSKKKKDRSSSSRAVRRIKRWRRNSPFAFPAQPNPLHLIVTAHSHSTINNGPFCGEWLALKRPKWQHFFILSKTNFENISCGVYQIVSTYLLLA
jgi:hypothetical protein